MGRVTIEQIVKHSSGDTVEPEILIRSQLYYKEEADKDPELKK